jgi:hypothetical protein
MPEVEAAEIILPAAKVDLVTIPEVVLQTVV